MQIKFLLRFFQVLEKSAIRFPQGFPQVCDRQNKANKSVILQQKDISGREVDAISSLRFELPIEGVPCDSQIARGPRSRRTGKKKSALSSAKMP
jgi:hypothetical protein